MSKGRLKVQDLTITDNQNYGVYDIDVPDIGGPSNRGGH